MPRTHRFPRSWSAAVLVAALALASGRTADRAADAGPAPADLHEAARRFAVCDAALAVVRGRHLDHVETAAGCPGRPDPDPDAVFEAASLGKPLFAYAVLQLVAEGRLALDAPVLGYLPGGYRHPRRPLAASSPSDPVDDPRLARVTVRMALEHTSGLPNFGTAPLAFESEPGSRWQYSGEGYLLLQRAVEAVTGEPLERLMAERVFAPLGMTHSSYVWDERLAPLAVRAPAEGASAPASRRFRTAVAATTLYTTAGDYGRFLAALLADRRMLALATASPVTADARRGLSWGLGWGIDDEAGSDGAGPVLWHWGNVPGYRAFAMASPARGDAFVLLTDAEDGLKLAPSIAGRLLPGHDRLFGFPMLR